MWLPLFECNRDYSQQRVMIPLSAGINSAAVLVYMATEYPEELRPRRVYIWYSHLIEHSPDSFAFVRDCIRYAQHKYECVTWHVNRASVLGYFRRKGMVPHPIFSPCSEDLKFGPMATWADVNGVDIDLVGYIRSESMRIRRQEARNVNGKAYPISHLTEDDCFALVDREIGWHPAIYDIQDANGKRVFRHNNCLPCKNMTGHMNGCEATGQYADVQLYYPEYAAKAMALSAELSAYWGRDADFEGYCKLCED